jgi:hypothetical protein
MAADGEITILIRERLRAADDLLARRDKAGLEAVRAQLDELLDRARSTLAVLDSESREWTFGHRLAGPAGALALPLGHGVVLEVDAAEPSRVLAVTAPDVPSAAPIVEPVAGTQAGQLICSGSDHEEPIEFPSGDERLLAALGRLAVLEEAREEVEPEAPEAGLWAAEAAWLCQHAQAVPGMLDRARSEADAAVSAIVALAGATVDTRRMVRLAELLPVLSGLADSREDREMLEAAAKQLRGRTPKPARRRPVAGQSRPRLWPRLSPKPLTLAWTGGRAMGATRSPVKAAQLQRAAPFRPPAGLEGRHGLLATVDSLAVLESGRLTVRCPFAPDANDPGAVWVRAYSKQDRLLFDSQPLTFDPEQTRDDVRFAVAVLQLLPNATHADFDLDITDAPDSPIQGSALWHLQAAIAAGRMAATDQRLGRDDDAAQHWRESAESWERAGDASRNEQARQQVDRAMERIARRRPDPSPFLPEL